MDNTVNFHDVRKRSRTENQFEGESPSSSALSDSVRPTAKRVRETVLGQLDNIEPTHPSSSAIHRAVVTHLANNLEQRFVQEFTQEIVKLLQPFVQKVEVEPDMPLETWKFPSFLFRQVPFDIKSLALCIEALLKKCPEEHCQEALKEALIVVLDINWVNENIKDKFIKILVKNGARITQDVEERVYISETALMMAIRYKDLKATHDLLARVNSSNVDRKEPCFNQTALTYAVDYGNLEALQTLLERGADVNHQDRYGVTVLMHAVDKEYLEAVQVLLARGADVNQKDNEGKTELMYAVDGKKMEIVQALLARGADVSQKDNEGRTVLTYAVMEYSDEITTGQSAKCMQIIKALVEKGADVNTTLTYLMAKLRDLPPVNTYGSAEWNRDKLMQAMWIVAGDLLDDPLS